MDINKVGQALYGNNWRAPLAKILGINERTIRRWADGEFDVNPAIKPDLIKLIDQNIQALNECKTMLNTFNTWIIKKHDIYKSVHGNVHTDVFIHLDPLDYYDDFCSYQIPSGWRFVKKIDDLSYLVTNYGEMIDATDMWYDHPQNTIYCDTKQGRVFFEKAQSSQQKPRIA